VAKKLLMRLRLATEIEMLGADPPLINGADGPRPMTIGDLIVQIIPSCSERDDANAIRLWNIGSDIDKSDKKDLELSKLDFDMLRNALKAGDRPLWVKVNLKNAFDEAKEVEKGNK